MAFDYLNDTLWPAAKAISLEYKRRKFRSEVEKPLLSTDNYRPTLIFKKQYFTTEIVEIKTSYKLDTPFYDFIQKCLAEQRPVKIWVCVPNYEGIAPSIQIEQEKQFKENGLGRYYFDGKRLHEMQSAVECHLRFFLPPGRKLIQIKRVTEAIDKFNMGKRIDGLRDMGEMLEQATLNLGIYSKRKGKLNQITVENFKSGDFEYKLNQLGAGAFGTRILEPELVTDLKAVKNTRNLIDHPRDRQKQRQFEEQCLSKMQESIRLLREIERIKQGIN